MKILFTVLILFMIHEAFSVNYKKSYEHFAVYKIDIKNVKQFNSIQLLKEQHSEKFPIWKNPNGLGSSAHFLVERNDEEEFLRLTKFYGIDATISIPNVQELLDKELLASSNSYQFDWTRYHNLREIEKFLDDILNKYPKVTKSFTIGKSFEGRPIRGIRISYKSDNPGIFIESNIHAREWITSATATYFINELLSSKEPIVRDMAENIDWYIIPVFNVDGFVHTHEHDRLWRKTRRPTNNSRCIGTDGNRNYPFHWLENGGSSSNPCDETFAGSAPISEPESKALTKYIASIRDKISIYLSFHSCGQLILTPYGHSGTEFPGNYADLLKIAKAAAEAIESVGYGTRYTYGSTGSILYTASGVSVDSLCHTNNIKVGLTFEFRDKGNYCFVLPAEQIIPNCQEAVAAIAAVVKESRRLKYL